MSDAPNPDWIIRAQKISRQFGSLTAINQLDLNIKRQQIYGFLGPNGCGKTTAIRMLTGLLNPSSGSIEVLGYKLPQDAAKLRLKMGYMTQKFSLYDDLTVNENLQFVSQIYGLRPNQQTQRIAELLNIYGLENKAKPLASTMSGGQRQRLALAAATLHKPQLLFLDEPTSAVDPQNRRDFWEQLFDLCDSGTTILVSTHYMDEAERCHQLAILENGIKRADGTPLELMANLPANIIEVQSNQLRQIKQQLMQLPQIISAAQLGTRLRVLVNKSIENPCEFLQSQTCISTQTPLHSVRPSLEDVFVSCTGLSTTSLTRTTHSEDNHG